METGLMRPGTMGFEIYTLPILIEVEVGSLMVWALGFFLSTISLQSK